MQNTNDNILNALTEFFRDLLKYWYILGISLGIMMGGALFYIKFAAKTYNVAASVMLKIERTNAYGGKSEDMMRVDQLIEQDKNLQNEIYFLKSTPLIKSVVEDMDLAVTYYLQEDKIPKEVEFSMKDLYDRAPFLIIPNKEHLQPVDFYIYLNIIDDETFGVSAITSDATIVDFRDESVVMTGAPFEISGVYKFGEEVSTPFISFKVLLNSNYNAESYQGKDLFFKFNTTGALTNVFRASLSVEASALDATMVDLSVICDNVEKGRDFLEGMIDKYIESNLDKKNYLAQKTIEHLNFQLADISKDLGSSEQELQQIRSGSSVMNIDEKAGNIYNQLQESETQRDEIQRRLNYLEQMEEYFSSNRDNSGFMAPSAMGLDDPLLSSMIGELTAMNSERQQYINNNQLRSPRLRTLEINIANMKQTILENLQYSISATRAELQEMNGKIGGLNREYSSLPRTQRQLLGIERRFNLSENVYMSLLEQKIQAQIIRASTLPDCEVIEPPQHAGVHAPKTRHHPDRCPVSLVPPALPVRVDQEVLCQQGGQQGGAQALYPADTGGQHPAEYQGYDQGSGRSAQLHHLGSVPFPEKQHHLLPHGEDEPGDPGHLHQRGGGQILFRTQHRQQLRGDQQQDGARGVRPEATQRDIHQDRDQGPGGGQLLPDQQGFPGRDHHLDRRAQPGRDPGRADPSQSHRTDLQRANHQAFRGTAEEV